MYSVKTLDSYYDTSYFARGIELTFKYIIFIYCKFIVTFYLEVVIVLLCKLGHSPVSRKMSFYETLREEIFSNISSFIFIL